MPDIEWEIRKAALYNALQHGGSASQGSVIGKLMSEMPEMKGRAKEVIPKVKEIVSQVNSLSIDEQRKELEIVMGRLQRQSSKIREKSDRTAWWKRLFRPGRD